ncbi:hypothetical protein EVAR_86187_1 [Eumeta japonica]|uniref:Uncharacterized protein n=1 Tax=Eumeta variegata TaxID=151549 RepID=A0A4C1UCX6_EUMVA|nr:hypothetical protein EVAR_86187_1 [Eumeta japonica]
MRCAGAGRPPTVAYSWPAAVFRVVSSHAVAVYFLNSTIIYYFLGVQEAFLAKLFQRFQMSQRRSAKPPRRRRRACRTGSARLHGERRNRGDTTAQST